MTHEEQQEFILLRSQFHQVSSSPYLPRGLIEFQVSIDKGFTSCLVATQHRPDPRQQLVERKRLGEIVVSTEVQSVHLIGDLVAGREHDDWDIVMEPQAPAHLESVGPWHGNIQEYNVRLMGSSSIQPGLAIPSSIHLEPLIGEAPLDQWDEMRVVVHQQDASDHTLTSIMLLRRS